MAWWITALLFVGSVVLQALLTKGPKVRPGDPQAPQADEGVPIPVLWGTVKVTPNCAWFGDVRRKRIKDGDLKRVTVGFQYFAGLQLVIGWGPLDELVEVYVGEKALSTRGPHREVVGYGGPFGSDPIYSDPIGAVSPALPLAPANVNAPTPLTLKDATLFGAKKREGGIGGTARLHWGGPGLAANAYLASHVVAGSATPVSASPNVACLVVEGMYLGNAPQLAPIAVAVRRFPAALSAAAGHPEWARGGAAKDGTDPDANAAEMIYETLTSGRFGFALNAGDELDVASFTACAAQLYAEGLGLSLAVTTARSGADVIRDLLRHVDGVLFQHPTTGRVTLRLVRQDYAADLAAGRLPVLDASTCADVVVEKSSWRALVSEVVVRYTDRARNYRSAEAEWHSLGTWRSSEGEARTLTEDYPACTTAAVAARIAERLGRVSATDLPRLTASVDRRAVQLAPGGVAVAHFPDQGLVHTVVRVTTADYGDLEDGRIRIEAVEDVFQVTGGIVAPPPDPAGADAPLAPSDGALEVSVTRQETATTGTVVLTVEDPDAVVTAVRFRTTVGGGAPGAWAAVAEPYARVITRDATRDTRVAWEVAGDVDGETGAVLAAGSETFAPAQVPEAPELRLALDPVTGAVTATVVPRGTQATQARCAGSTAGDPSDAAVDAAAPDASAPFTFALGALAVGETLYAKAVVSDGTVSSAYATNHITRGTPLLGGSPALAVLREATGLQAGDYLDLVLPPGTLLGVRVDADVAASFEVDLLALPDPGPAGPAPDWGAAVSLAGGPVAVAAAAYYADDALAGWTRAVPVRTWVRVQVVTAAPGLTQLSVALFLQRA